jgi:hypothetical protein
MSDYDQYVEEMYEQWLQDLEDDSYLGDSEDYERTV